MELFVTSSNPGNQFKVRKTEIVSSYNLCKQSGPPIEAQICYLPAHASPILFFSVPRTEQLQKQVRSILILCF
jgi:hypothetical protein